MGKPDITPYLQSIQAQPCSNIVWRHYSELCRNDYNPNRVYTEEMRLLLLSILEDGWTHPVLVASPDPETGLYPIIDGEHRWRASHSPELYVKYGGFLPTVLVPADRVGRMMSTVRHNRARGQHLVLPMAEMVCEMRDTGVPQEFIMRGLGMEAEEVTRLCNQAGMPATHGNTEFSTAWVTDPES